MPRKRCPNGTRKNQINGECEPKHQQTTTNKNNSHNPHNSINTKKISKEVKLTKKCPEGKYLNPTTNRCNKLKLSGMSGKRYKFTFKNGNNKIRRTQIRLSKKMRKELVDKGDIYQKFKKEQIEHKILAKAIQANNLVKTRNILKKLKHNSSESNNNKTVTTMDGVVSSAPLKQINNTQIPIDESVLKTTLLKHGNGSKSINGHSLKLLKSAMQKYIRRGNDKAMTVFGELNIFSSLCHPDNVNFNKYLELHPELKESGIKKNGKGTITNTINRLRAIVSEDISVAGPGVPAVADELIEKYYLDTTNPYPILKLVKILIESKKIRLLSDLKTVYNLPPYYGKNDEDNKRIVKYTSCLNGIYNNTVESNAPEGSSDPISDNISYYFKAKDLKVFYWISKLIYKDGIDAVYRLVESMNKWRRNMDVVVLMKWFKLMKHKERSLYLYHSIIIQMNDIKSVKIEMDDSVMFPKLKNRYMDAVKSYEIDSWCMDIHTGKKGATVIEFGEVGADVTNESKKWFNQMYRDMYIHMKYALVHRPKTEEQMALLYKPSTVKTKQAYKFAFKKAKDKAKDKSGSTKHSKDVKLDRPSESILPGVSKSKSNPSTDPSSETDPFKDSIVDLSGSNESDLFSVIARAQIPTSSFKTDVYFGRSTNTITGYPVGTRVVVKGPYVENDLGYKFALDINTIKKTLNLPRNDRIMLIRMKPNRWGTTEFKDGRTGVRYNKAFDSSRPYWFMISVDYLKNIELPVKMYGTKTWPETRIIDFEKIVSSKDNTFNKWDAHCWDNSLDKHKMEFVFYILFRYMMGIGDFAARNFVFIDNVVYGIDEDAPKKGDLKTFRSLLNKTRSAQVAKWIEAHWDNVSKFIDKLVKLKDSKFVTDIIKPFNGYDVKDPVKIYGNMVGPDKVTVLKLFE